MFFLITRLRDLVPNSNLSVFPHLSQNTAEQQAENRGVPGCLSTEKTKIKLCPTQKGLANQGEKQNKTKKQKTQNPNQNNTAFGQAWFSSGSPPESASPAFP